MARQTLRVLQLTILRLDGVPLAAIVLEFMHLLVLVLFTVLPRFQGHAVRFRFCAILVTVIAQWALLTELDIEIMLLFLIFTDVPCPCLGLPDGHVAGGADVAFGILIVGEPFTAVIGRRIDTRIQRSDKLTSLRGSVNQVVTARIGGVPHDVVELDTS